ncbi:hypothetical protein LF1_52820 [Rubripirellula obstinata]|uniref:Uncharacterized protein n=1 Tax=Rubripirellula obstinata TaxID=406547 RepID=A0A5B1CDD5_9BACT|nr:hypothetical protein LF1_52820 [Rubripirellula obstinata]
MLEQRRCAGCTAWHQPTPEFEHSISCWPTKLARLTTLCYDLTTVMVTHGDEVRADGPYRDGVLRITIACTGVAAAHFSLCLHVKSRHLGDACRYPTGCAVSPLQRGTFDRLLSYTSRLVTSDRLLGRSLSARAGRSLTLSPLHPGPNSDSALVPLLARRSRRLDSPLACFSASTLNCATRIHATFPRCITFLLVCLHAFPRSTSRKRTECRRWDFFPLL